MGVRRGQETAGVLSFMPPSRARQNRLRLCRSSMNPAPQRKLHFTIALVPAALPHFNNPRPQATDIHRPFQNKKREIHLSVYLSFFILRTDYPP